MKKIKHIKDIHHEKMRLRIQQLEHEKAIRNSWKEIKEDLRPGTFLRNRLTELTQKKPEEGHLISGLVNYGAHYLSRRLTGMAGEKIESTLQLGIEKLSKKMKSVFGK